MKKEEYRSLISNLMDAVEKLSEASGALIAAIPEDDRDDALWDFIDDVKDGVFDTVDGALDDLDEYVLGTEREKL